MANSLLPDLGAEQSKKKSEIIAEFDYDNTNDEVDGAMKTFQYNFSSKRGILSIAAYALLLIVAVVMIIFNPTMYILYAALAICLFGLFSAVTIKKRMRRRVIKALESMNPETYHCRIFSNKVEIETIIQPKEGEDPAEKSENDPGGDPEPAPLMSVYKFGEDMLDFAENSESFLLVVARRQFYTFPKRCLSDEQAETVRSFLSEKTDSYYEQ